MSGLAQVVNNTFSSNSDFGSAGESGPGCTGNGGNGTAGAITSPSGITVANNIFAFHLAVVGAGSAVGTGSAGALSASGPIITNNLFFDNAVSGAAGSANTAGTNSLTSNLLFTLAPTNPQIASVSPAKAAGTVTGAPV